MDSAQKNSDSNQNVKLEVVEFVSSSGDGEKIEYTRLEKWRDQSQHYPRQTLEVACRIKNDSSSAIQDGDFIVLSTMDFVVGRQDLPTPTITELEKSHTWGRISTVDDQKMEILPYMQPGGTTRITFKDFDLTRMINEFNEADDILWVWAVRVNINILDRDMKVVAHGKSVLPMLPRDVSRK